MVQKMYWKYPVEKNKFCTYFNFEKLFMNIFRVEELFESIALDIVRSEITRQKTQDWSCQNIK